MRVSFFRSLRFRIIAGVVLIEVVMLSAMVWNNVSTITRTHTQRLNETAHSLVRQLADSAGVYMFQVDYASLEEYARTVLGHPEVIYVMIVDDANHPVVKLGEAPAGIPSKLEPDPRSVRDGVFDVAADIAPQGRYQGKVYLGFTLALMEETITEARSVSIAIALTEIVLSVLATIWIGLSLTRGLHSLAAAASRLGEGDFQVSLPTERQDEVGLVAATFDRMAVALETRSRELQESRKQIQLLMNSIEEGICGFDLEGTCTFVNAACVRMLGFTREQDLLGRNFQDFIRCSSGEVDTHGKGNTQLAHWEAGGIVQREGNKFLSRNDGSAFPVEFWSHPIYQDSRKVGVVVTFIDISARREVEEKLAAYQGRLEELVAERTAQLQATNQELEAFSYSVSHDLRAPLRAIDGFSRALLEDYGARLDETARDFLQRICGGAARMGELIDDLLQLSRVTRSALTQTEVDLRRLAEEVTAKLREQEPEREVTLVLREGLRTRGDARLLTIVLENLFSNAWKFTRRTDAARIEFGVTDAGEVQAFYIRDNGVGFDMAYADNLFGAFQRLHHAWDFEGTGIGLATVQRIIHRHGGRVWAESRPGDGATFYFTLQDTA